MIYTITFNPAIDYITEIEKSRIDEINRVKTEKVLAGGKGINVSIVLKNLGIESTALGFIAGFTGKEIKERLEKIGVKTDFVEIKNQFSRINVKIRSSNEKNLSETAINGNGPIISEKHLEELLRKLENIKEEDVLILGGSISQNIPNDIYEKICKKVCEKNNGKTKIIVDATGTLLKNVLKYNPFLIKPNKYELEEVFEIQISNNDEIITYAKKLQNMGAKNVLISMDKSGAILLTEENNVLYTGVPKGKLVNSVGAGDSMVAGFLAGYIIYDDFEKAFKLGVSAGSASAFSPNLATKEEILNIFYTMGNSK